MVGEGVGESDNRQWSTLNSQIINTPYQSKEESLFLLLKWFASGDLGILEFRP